MLWMLCTQDTPDAGDALHPRIFQMPGLLCTQDTLDAGDALDSRILRMLRLPEAQLCPPSSLQSSVPGVPELLRAPRCCCCSWSRQERQSSLRRGPGCSQPSPPGRRKIRSVEGISAAAEERPARREGGVSGCVQVPARLSPAAVDARKGCRNADRGGGAGGERRR